jgi:hypothetical protein
MTPFVANLIPRNTFTPKPSNSWFRSNRFPFIIPMLSSRFILLQITGWEVDKELARAEVVNFGSRESFFKIFVSSRLSILNW